VKRRPCGLIPRETSGSLPAVQRHIPPPPRWRESRNVTSWSPVALRGQRAGAARSIRATFAGGIVPEPAVGPKRQSVARSGLKTKRAGSFPDNSAQRQPAAGYAPGNSRAPRWTAALLVPSHAGDLRPGQTQSAHGMSMCARWRPPGPRDVTSVTSRCSGRGDIGHTCPKSRRRTMGTVRSVGR